MARRQSVVSEGSDFEVDPSADWEPYHNGRHNLGAGRLKSLSLLSLLSVTCF